MISNKTFIAATGKTFIAATGRELRRATCDTGGNWSVDSLLADKTVNCLAADPLNGDVIYAGTKNEGVLRSDDRGQTWQPAGLDGHTVKALAASPHQPGVLYAGTRPALVFKSHDGGRSWNKLEAFCRVRGRRLWFSPAEPPDFRAYVQSLTISPTEPDTILAGIEFGAVLRSSDGGQTWSNHIKNTLRDCHDMKYHASNGNWVYEAGGSGGGATFSRDGGLTWQKAKKGLAKHYGVSCAADPERPEVWYVAVAPSPGKAYGEEAEVYLYRASGGAEWQPIGWQAHPLPQMPMALVTDPSAPGHLYAGLSYGAVWHSADYGDSWQQLPFDLGRVWRSMIII